MPSPARPDARLKARALRLLARREHSRAELAGKLAATAEEGADLSALLDRLEALGLLSDARFAESFVSARIARFGNRRLAYELRKRGVADTLIAQAVSGGEAEEIARARAVRQRRFAERPSNPSDHARQARFLQQRGFSPEVIRRAFKEDEE